ncbi:unnamed protein product [Orchesella dallaii]|uniref:Arrestin-like N-terminal domain-containing protein n=1 Tax=Orchesella dallaii TaxID=48710 RepID=A0ABP1QWK5_9HEXA
MALAAGLHGCVRTSFYRPGKIERFGANFKVRILVDNETIRPFRKITGKLVIETRFPISHKGIQIQFEALCSLKYTTKFDNLTTFHQARAHIFDNNRHDAVGNYEFPIAQELLPPSQNTILPGSVTFPFSLDFPDPHLPAPFKNAFGNLTYRVVVYMKASSTFVEIGEKAMRFNGHYNLTDNLDSLKPISIEQFYKKSVFSRKRLVEATFSLETSGYLPEERIQFVLFVRNLKCIPLQMSVQLMQQLKIDARDGIDSAKRKSIIIASCERAANHNFYKKKVACFCALLPSMF